MTCVNSVSVYPSRINIKVGEWYHGACAEVCPTDADCACVRWSSSNPDVASVNSVSGYIYGNSAGTATIYATAQDGSGECGCCTVTVSQTISVSSITLSKSSLTLQENDSYTLCATVCPDNATNKSVIWCSSNTNIATVSGGVVYAKSKGSATITASSADGSVSDCCTVKVTGDTLVSSVTVSPSSKCMTVGGSSYLKATVCPEGATCPCITWCSSNTSVATVNPTSGLVMAQGAGTAIIYATAQDGSGKQGSCIIYCDICTCCDTYTNELIETFGFTNSDALLIRSLYDKVDDKFSSESNLMKAWRCSRLLGGIIYGNESISVMDISGHVKDIMWHQISGVIFSNGETEEEHFTNILGYTSAEYLQLKNAVTTQHEDSSTPDFVHMQISLAARLAYNLDLDGIASDIGTAIVGEDVSYFAGWLGDATLSYGGTTSFRDDDYCADLDAENIYRLIIQGHTVISAANTYYGTLLSRATRAHLFLGYIDYSTIEDKVISILVAISEEDPMSKIKADYPDTYNFLYSLKDGLAHMAEY